MIIKYNSKLIHSEKVKNILSTLNKDGQVDDKEVVEAFKKLTDKEVVEGCIKTQDNDVTDIRRDIVILLLHVEWAHRTPKMRAILEKFYSNRCTDADINQFIADTNVAWAEFKEKEWGIK